MSSFGSIAPRLFTISKFPLFARDLLNSDYAGHRLTFQLFAQSPPFAHLGAVYRTFDWSAPLRLATRTLTWPPVAVAVLTAVLVVWHLPSFYGAAVRNEGIHLLEHTCFVAAALLFWGPLLDAPPVRARIDHLRRAAYFVAAAVPGWILAIVLAEASRPLYPVYAGLSHRAFGLSALGDQQLAAGIMWVPGSLAYTVAFVLSVYRWLEPGAAEASAPEPRPEELSWT